MKKLPFKKLHGIWNDFILLQRKDIIKLDIEISKEFTQRMCNRNFWIGSDGLLIIDSSDVADYKYTMYNPDGSCAEMCGNWIRCFMKYLLEEKITSKKKISVETGAWVLQLELEWEEIVVDMWIPWFDKDSIWISDNATVNGIIESAWRKFEYLAVSTGNPHAIIFIEEDLSTFDVEKYGAPIESCTTTFMNKINVSFVEKVNDVEINHRVYERWAGETLACWTAVTWTISAAIKQWVLKAWEEIKVNLRAWTLHMRWSWNLQDSAFMRWPAEATFEGVYYVKE